MTRPAPTAWSALTRALLLLMLAACADDPALTGPDLKAGGGGAAARNRTRKRGGELHIVADGVELVSGVANASAGELEELGTALEGLSGLDPALAELVDLHFFCGFSFAEIAEIRGVSERTVYRDWRKARLLLHRSLQEP